VEDGHADEARKCNFPIRIVHTRTGKIILKSSVIVLDPHDFQVEEHQNTNLTQSGENYKTKNSLELLLIRELLPLLEVFVDFLFS